MIADRELERIRRELIDRRTRLAGEVEDSRRRRLEEEDVESMVGDVGDSGDVATATEQADLRTAQIERDLVELRAVNAALARLADGQYGICVRCGCEIGEARLRANPIAERCIDCQTILEHQMARRPASL